MKRFVEIGLVVFVLAGSVAVADGPHDGFRGGPRGGPYRDGRDFRDRGFHGYNNNVTVYRGGGGGNHVGNGWAFVGGVLVGAVIEHAWGERDVVYQQQPVYVQQQPVYVQQQPVYQTGHLEPRVVGYRSVAHQVYHQPMMGTYWNGSQMVPYQMSPGYTETVYVQEPVIQEIWVE